MNFYVCVVPCSKLINVSILGTIDDRATNTKWAHIPWERNENHTLCLNSAKAIGCIIVNIGTQDSVKGRVSSTVLVLTGMHFSPHLPYYIFLCLWFEFILVVFSFFFFPI